MVGSLMRRRDSDGTEDRGPSPDGSGRGAQIDYGAFLDGEGPNADDDSAPPRAPDSVVRERRNLTSVLTRST